MAKQWKKYLLWFAQEHIEFRITEVESLLSLFKIEMRYAQKPQNKEPYWIVEFSSEGDAKLLTSRSVTLRNCMELWSHEKSMESLHTSLKKKCELFAPYFDPAKSFKIEVETFCRHFTQQEKVNKLETFTYLPIRGSVKLRDPDMCLQYIEYYGTRSNDPPELPYEVFFGRRVENGLRQLIKKLSLKTRKFIGNTSMDPQLSLLMANQAQIKNGDIILDPFVGSGSLLVAAAEFGGYVFGSDIDYLMLHGKTKPSRIRQKERASDESVRANMKQYNLEHKYLDILVNDFAMDFWRDSMKFDAIITDPPYGIRESTGRVGTEKRNYVISDEHLATHIPAKIEYGIPSIYRDLLIFSSKHLRLGGRLVCWFPVYREDYTEKCLPTHPCLKLVGNSEQPLSKITSRRLLTYEKVKHPSEEELNLESTTIQDFREKYFIVREETRKEKRLREATVRKENWDKHMKSKEKYIPYSLRTMTPSIVIVGAGAAGIAAATKIVSRGFKNVTILEAENRIGGRLYSIPFGGTTIDLGAQWIHGEEGNIVYETVKGLNITDHTKTTNYYSDLTFFASNNAKLNKKLTERLSGIAQLILDDETSAIEWNGSLGDYFKEKYYEKIKQEFGSTNNEILRLANMIAEWTSKFFLCLDPAGSMDEISARSLIMYKKCEGDPLVNWKNHGFEKFLDVLIMELLNLTRDEFLKQHVLLNKEVKSIAWNTDTLKDKEIKIYCKDGSFYSADHVIVTVSVAVLKHIHKRVFQPSLPDWKIHCLEHIPLGGVHKIFLKFSQKWWPDDVKDFSFLWTDEDKIILATEFADGPTLNGRSWVEDLFGFYTVDCDPNILLGWVVGPMTNEVENLPDKMVQKASMFLLRKFVGQFYDVVEPTDIVRSKWVTNPHFLGTYSYFSLDMEQSGASNEDLAKPLCVDGKPVVLFAGEATHSQYFSTVHGAVETGYREADRLLNIYKSSDHYKVIIVGAGMAGLGAATKLMENGIKDFIIFEAQSQPGGRIKTIVVNNKPLDVGAQWMHGKSNPLYKLAVEHNLLSDKVSEEGLGQYIRSNGDIIDPFIVESVAFKIGQILEDCAKLIDSDNYPLSLRDYLDEHFLEYLHENVTESDVDIYMELYDWHVRFQVIDNSCLDLSRLSAKSWGEYVCLDDEAHSNLKYGYQSLVKVILNSLPNECIKYNSQVASISFTENKKVTLSDKDGTLLVCDHLILTPSLGVLKEFDGLANVLPENLMANIRNMGYDGICKIFFFYDQKWWGDMKGFQLLWHKECNFNEKYSWMRQITGFDEVFNHENALMTWVGGNVVREVETLPTDIIARQCTELLQKFLVNYSVPVPNKVIRTKWLSNPFVKGSYCHITPECDSPNSGIRALGEPVIVDGVPRIILAGEAIHPSHYSTTHGAFESGLEQAGLICDYVSNVK